jgi:hypothetical protein
MASAESGALEADRLDMDALIPPFTRSREPDDARMSRPVAGSTDQNSK